MDQEEIYKKFQEKIPSNLQDYSALYQNSIENRDGSAAKPAKTANAR